MKGIKKIFAIAILAVMMALCSFGVMSTAFADEAISTGGQVIVGANQVQTEVGKKETLTFSAKGNSNIAGFNFVISLPTNVTFAEFEIAEQFADSNYQCNASGTIVNIICNSANENYADETILFTIDVIARETGFGEVWYMSSALTDVNANYIGYNCNPSTIEVFGVGQGPAIKGDVDGDEQVSIKDLMLMQKFIVGTLGDETYFSTNAGDVDANGLIDLFDCQNVQRYLINKITFEELQALSNNSGGNDYEDDGEEGGSGTGQVKPDDPSMYITYFDVMYGAQRLPQAIKMDRRDYRAEFTFEGQVLHGTILPLFIIDEYAIDSSAAFIPEDSSDVFMFVLGDETTVKLDGVYNLDDAVEKDPANFNKNLAGDYIICNQIEELAYITVQENGVFTGFENFRMDGMYYSLNITGVISEDEGTTYLYMLGMNSAKLEVQIDARNGIIYILENGEVAGSKVHFDICYILENGNVMSAEAYYTLKESDDINDVGKMLAHKNLIEGFEIIDYEVRFLQDGRYLIEAWVRETGNQGGGSGDVSQGKEIALYMLVKDSKHEMLQPIGPMKFASIEQFNQMLADMTNMPAETQMQFVGLYTDRACKMPYEQDMGLDISELYILCTYSNNVNMLVGFGGTFRLVSQDNNGEEIAVDGRITINEENKTFTLLIGSENAKTYTGEAIVSSFGTDKNGELRYCQLSLITNNNIQINGTLDLKAENGGKFTIHGIEDYSSYTSNEAFKDIAGEYTCLITTMGMDMGRCTITLQDNGVFSLQMFYMKQIGSYDIRMSMTGATIVMTVDGYPQDGTIDFENKIIVINVQSQSDGPSGGENSGTGNMGGDNVGTEEFVGTVFVVSTQEKMRVPFKADSYDALKEELCNMFGDFDTFTVYLDPEQKIQLSTETFGTVRTTFYIVFNEQNDAGYDNGYENGDGEVSDKVIIIK